MSDSGTDDLVTIGAFARATGLTPSALRFYDDSGLLAPAYIDPATGYRYYAGRQRARASTIRRLRAIEVPLDAVTRILSADPGEAARLLDEHVRFLRRRADAAAAEADAVKAALSAGRQAPPTALPGLLLADAVERVLPAAAADAEFPVLTGVLVERGAGAVTFTATDRYRLSTRSVAAPAAEAPWSAVVPVGELSALVPWLAGAAEVGIDRAADAVVFTATGDQARCGILPGTFPDYGALLAALPPTCTRVIVAREALLDAVEGEPDETIRCAVVATGMSVGPARGSSRTLAAHVTGPDVELSFRRGNLYAAAATSIGPDLMLDISAADQPVVLRSATDGDLTTLAMPTASNT